MERTGKLSALNIPDDAGLAETAHFVFFADGVLGAEFNFFGPRSSRLAAFLADKAAEECQSIRFAPVLRGDTRALLDKLRHIVSVKLSIRAPFIPKLVAEAPTLGEAFRSIHRASDAEVIQLELKPTPRSMAEIAKSFVGLIRSLASGMDHEGLAGFRVKGREEPSGPVHEVNVLNELLFVQERMMLQDRRTRAIQRESAYAAIEQAYEENRDALASYAEAEQ
jgi:hypothetical protein